MATLQLFFSRLRLRTYQHSCILKTLILVKESNISIRIRTVIRGVKCNTKEGLFSMSVCTKTVEGLGQASVKSEFAEVNMFL